MVLMVCETMLPVSWEEQGRLYQQFELCTGSLQELAETENNIPERLIWGYLVDLLQVQYSCTESTDREQHPGAAHLGIPGGPAPGIVVQLCIHRGGAIRVTLMWIQSLPG